MADTGVWGCSHCHTNNAGTSAVCRRCRSPRDEQRARRPTGAASGISDPDHDRVETTRDPVAPTTRERPPPPPAPGPHSAPVPTAGPGRRPAPFVTVRPPAGERAAPTPAARPATPARRRRPGRIVAALAGLGLVGLVVPNLPLGSGDGATTATAACPQPTARALPGGGDGSVLVAAYETDRFHVTLCRDAAGGLFYDGVSRSPTGGRITLPARVNGDRVEARNGSYVYEIGSGRLRVLRDDEEVLDAALRPRSS